MKTWELFHVSLLVALGSSDVCFAHSMPPKDPRGDIRNTTTADTTVVTHIIRETEFNIPPLKAVWYQMLRLSRGPFTWPVSPPTLATTANIGRTRLGTVVCRSHTTAASPLHAFHLDIVRPPTPWPVCICTTYTGAVLHA